MARRGSAECVLIAASAVTPEATKKLGFSAGASSLGASATDSQLRQLVLALEKHYDEDLRRMPRSGWFVAAASPSQPPIDVAEAVGVPATVLGAILAGKCKDQHIHATPERQRRFAEWMQSHCSSLWFTLNDAGVGPECAKGVALCLALNDRFTSLNLSCNCIGDAGAQALAQLLPQHETIVHLDLAANDIGHRGSNAIFDALLHNRSVTHLDISSRAGSLRNRLAPSNAPSLEKLITENPVLAKLSLSGGCLGTEGGESIARALTVNTALTALDLSGNDLGVKAVSAIASSLALCGLEELNLSDNRMGDDGLSILAAALGALPDTVDEAQKSEIWHSLEGIKIAGKYLESVASTRRVIQDLKPAALSLRDDAARKEALARAMGCCAQLTSCVEVALVRLPKLRTLVLTETGGSHQGVGRIEDALQKNIALERLVLDGSNHRGAEFGARALITSLPINHGLKSLSLNHCKLGTLGVTDLAKALSLNRTLESLSLRGNPFGEAAAVALGAVMGSTTLRQLNISSCHLDDSAGVALGAGLSTNIGLESLHLRDNCLRQVSGKAFTDALRSHTSLTFLSLDLNSIDCRSLAQIQQLLNRNMRLREKSRPQRYRDRIEQLMECEKEVNVLNATLRRNHLRKRKAKIKQAAVLQELKDAQGDEEKQQEELERKMAEVKEARRQIDDEYNSARETLRVAQQEGAYEANQLELRISDVERRIGQHQKHIQKTSLELEHFEARAGEEVQQLRRELEKARKARQSAQLLSEAAQRHLDSFSASLKSIEPDIAGGADPRQRMSFAHESQKLGATNNQLGQSRRKGGSPRPRTPVQTRSPRKRPVRA